jgi:hypothetical protein
LSGPELDAHHVAVSVALARNLSGIASPDSDVAVGVFLEPAAVPFSGPILGVTVYAIGRAI